MYVVASGQVHLHFPPRKSRNTSAIPNKTTTMKMMHETIEDSAATSSIMEEFTGSKNGPVRILDQVLDAGACVGELALLSAKSNVHHHLASAVTLSECILLEISKTSFYELIQQHTSIARGVLDALATALKWSTIAHTWTGFESESDAESGARVSPRSSYSSLPFTHSSRESKRLHRLVSQVNTVSIVHKAASTLLSKISTKDSARQRSKTEDLAANLHQSLSTHRTVIHTDTSHSPLSKHHHHHHHHHLLDYSSLPSSTMDHHTKIHRQPTKAVENITYTHLEKCLHLKASQLMKDVEDELVRYFTKHGSKYCCRRRRTTLNTSDRGRIELCTREIIAIYRSWYRSWCDQ